MDYKNTIDIILNDIKEIEILLTILKTAVQFQKLKWI